MNNIQKYELERKVGDLELKIIDLIQERDRYKALAKVFAMKIKSMENVLKTIPYMENFIKDITLSDDYTKFTCYTCKQVGTCVFAFDDYNINNECLMEH